jgi:cell division septation protein DedD
MLRFPSIRLRHAVFALGILAGAVAPAAAQAHRTALGASAGWATYGDLTPGFGWETVLESGWTVGAELETWPGARRVGIRLNLSYAERTLEETSRAFRVATGDVAVLVRLLPAVRGRMAAPFLGIGGGLVAYRARDHSIPLGEGQYGDDPVRRVMAAPSVGVDLFTEAPVGLRLEAVDYIVFPAIGESPPATGFPSVHNPVVRTAVQFRFGRPPPRPIVARPSPPEPVAPEAVEPEPVEPEPAEPEPVEPEPVEPEPVEPEPVAPEPAPPVQPAPEAVAPPEPVAPTPAPEPVPPVRDPHAAVFTVQIGSFAVASTAARWGRNLEAAGLPLWVTQTVVEGRQVSRVRVGVVETWAEAQRLAAVVRREFGYETWVDMVGLRETPPPGALDASRRFMAGR